MKNKLWKLSKMLISLKEYVVGDVKLIISGDIVEGVEVAVEGEDGNLQPAADGEYNLEDKIIVVVDGKVTEIKDIEEPEPEPEQLEENVEPEPENNEPDEKDLRIQELEGLLADRDAVIEELTAKIKELEEQLNKPVEEPVKMAKTVKEQQVPKSGALKYFEK